MKIFLLAPVASVLLSGAFVAACDAAKDASETPSVESHLNEPFTLPAGQTAVFAEEKLRLTFLGAQDDSRCPVDAVCIRAGDATMSVRAEQEGRAAMTLTLTLTGENRDVVYEGFGIHAQELTPAPRTDRIIRPADYRVKLLVDRP